MLHCTPSAVSQFCAQANGVGDSVDFADVRKIKELKGSKPFILRFSRLFIDHP